MGGVLGWGGVLVGAGANYGGKLKACRYVPRCLPVAILQSAQSTSYTVSR